MRIDLCVRGSPVAQRRVAWPDLYLPCCANLPLVKFTALLPERQATSAPYNTGGKTIQLRGLQHASADCTNRRFIVPILKDMAVSFFLFPNP